MCLISLRLKYKLTSSMQILQEYFDLCHASTPGFRFESQKSITMASEAGARISINASAAIAIFTSAEKADELISLLSRKDP